MKIFLFAIVIAVLLAALVWWLWFMYTMYKSSKFYTGQLAKKDMEYTR